MRLFAKISSFILFLIILSISWISVFRKNAMMPTIGEPIPSSLKVKPVHLSAVLEYFCLQQPDDGSILPDPDSLSDYPKLTRSSNEEYFRIQHSFKGRPYQWKYWESTKSRGCSGILIEIDGVVVELYVGKMH